MGFFRRKRDTRSIDPIYVQGWFDGFQTCLKKIERELASIYENEKLEPTRRALTSGGTTIDWEYIREWSARGEVTLFVNAESIMTAITAFQGAAYWAEQSGEMRNEQG